MFAAEDAYNPFEHPDPGIASFYKSKRDEIADAAAKAKNRALPPADRVSALQTLFDHYNDHAILIAAELAGDADAGVAALASTILSNAAVMMDHPMDPGMAGHAHGGQPAGAPLIVHYEMMKHHLIMSVLRTLVSDPREAVHAPAAKILASQSDAAGLQNISAAAENGGVYSEQDAVRFLALAAPQKSAPYVEKYLSSSNEDVQSVAVECLTQAPAYRDSVRDKYLLNSQAPLKARLAAARGLTEARDLIPLIASPATPAPLYKAAMQTYLQTHGSQLSTGEIRYLREGLQRLPFTADDLKPVDAELIKLQQARSP